MVITEGIVTRFWSRVDKRGPDECWMWRGSVNKSNGYGAGYIGRTMNAHRVAYILTYGSIDPALDVCHTCDTPLCVNPAHLWAGTTKENMNDASRKGRMVIVLSPERVRELRLMHATGMYTYRDLTALFGVSLTTVRHHLKRGAASHVVTVVRDADGFYAVRDGAVVGTGSTAAEALAASA